MPRSFVLLVALAATACASTQRPPNESPASPGASSAPTAPPNTSLAADETPGLATTDGRAGEAAPGGMSGMVHAPDAGSSSMPPDGGSSTAPSNTPASSNQDHESAPPPSASADPVRLEREAFDRAHPVFVRFCAECHTTQGARHAAARLRHFSMDGYPFGGHHATTIGRTIREVLGAAGEPATMPDDHPGAVQGADLALVLAWADAWDRMHNRGVPAAGGSPSHAPERGRALQQTGGGR